MVYQQEQIQQMEKQAQRLELYREKAIKNLEECPECHEKVPISFSLLLFLLLYSSSIQSLEREYTSVGIILCLSLWWMCGLGFCLCRCLRSDFCQQCYTEHYLMKAHERRLIEVFVHDLSLVEIPLNETKKKKK
ncbi:hypothetical protein PRIPAC_89302 [Pristionchus pacificus]|uniref:Uncharacterized protein n=1 Tax=Pristionchus pacificus TaxID=54126 RepID=A0A2A6B5S1_PRIPA|nr:hypothetical protein PRIPAC_89302 [Pristionchus pacificus]|eukprot:PDM61198.1 hypothetical protein PRIPAC_50640 [Pristionchus pacificus]